MTQENPEEKKERHWTPNPTGKGLPPGKWNNLPTKLIRVPQTFAEEILAIARAMDRGELSRDSLRQSPLPDEVATVSDYLPGDRVKVKLVIGGREEVAKARIFGVYPDREAIGVHVLSQDASRIAQSQLESLKLIQEIEIPLADVIERA